MGTDLVTEDCARVWMGSDRRAREAAVVVGWMSCITNY